MKRSTSWVRKGLHLDILSWYVLLASYIVGLAVHNVRTSILVSVVTGFLVRWYYFLEPRPFGGPPVRRRKLPNWLLTLRRSRTVRSPLRGGHR